ncbi:MAG: AEC family transporter [Hyphomicrobiaceae bacterium]
MQQIITIVVPVFGLIALGWAVLKVGYVSQTAGRALAEFAFKVAMPALLFKATLSLGELPGSPIQLAAAYFSAAAIVWLLAAVATATILKRSQADASAIAMGSTFSNSVMLGIPLALTTFGPEAAAPAALLITFDSPILWIAATLHIQASRRDGGGSLLQALGRIVLDLLKNPIIMSLLAGTLARLAGITLPPLADRMITLVADAALPCALIALGMSLATYKLAGQTASLTVICILKLAVFPLLAYVFVTYVFDLPPVWAAVAILFAAMPVGANAYLFAERYGAAVGSVSTSIAISTAIAIVSVSALLIWLSDRV